MPASSALCRTRAESAGSELPSEVANLSVPSAYGLTLMPVRPRVRYCMTVTPDVWWKLSGKPFRYFGTIRKDFPFMQGRVVVTENAMARRPRPDGGRRTRADAQRN